MTLQHKCLAKRTKTFTCKLIKMHLGWQHKKEGWVLKMWCLTNLNVIYWSTTNDKLIYFPTNSCKLQKHLGSLKIQSLKSVLLGKIHACFWIFPFWISRQQNETGEILDLASLGIIQSRQQTTKALIRLLGCTGWSTPFLFAYGINRFSHIYNLYRLIRLIQ